MANMDTTTVDLTQLKWASLRSLEQTQAVEKENLLLRVEIADLRAKVASAAAASSSSSSSSQPRLDVGPLQRAAAGLREDLGQLRRAVHADVDGCQSDVVLAARELCGQLLAKVLARDQQIARLTAAHAALGAEVAQLRAAASSADAAAMATRQQQATLDDALSKLAAAREELTKSERRREELADEGRATKQQLEAALREGKQAAARADAVGAEARRLQARLSVVEYESKEAVDAATRAEADTREQCERILVDFESENSFLFKRIGELEGENERLRALLSVPKTDNNFAKFVQLKSENAALKMKLNTAARKKLAMLGMRNGGNGNGNGNNGSNSSSTSAASPALSSSSSGGGGGGTLQPRRPAAPEPLSVSCDDSDPSASVAGGQAEGPATSATVSTATVAAPGCARPGSEADPEPARRTSKIILIPQINSSDELADDDSCFGNDDDEDEGEGEEGDRDGGGPTAGAAARVPRPRGPASADTQRSTWSSQPPTQPAHATTPPTQGRGRNVPVPAASQRPIDDSDDEFSPLKRPPKPFPGPPGPPGPPQRQKGQTTVGGVMMATSSSLDIGVPLLSKQTRTALKDRIVV